MSDKRVIEQPASEEIFHDDWILKDSPLHETSKMLASVFMALIADQAKDGMVPYAMLATEWTALTTYYKDQVVIYNGELYRAKDTNVSPTFNPNAWTKVSFDTLYRTTLANVKNSICEEWSTSGEYTLNDCAIHEDKLYKCVADTATVGTWVSNEWELVSIYEMIQNLPKSASDVTYDNTESGLESENVQDALDEVVETITELSNTTEVTGTASGAIATFTDGADAPLKSLKVAVTPYQDLSHGDPSPENICPIIGWDEAVVTRCGKNLFDYTNISAVSAGSVSDRNGTLFNKAGTYSVNAVNSGSYMYVRVFNSDGSIKTTYNVIVSTTITPATFTISSGEWFVVYDANPDTLDVSKGLFENWQVQVELSSQPTSYQPYNGATYTIDLNGTRYGGDLDVLNGVDTDTLGSVDLGDLNWSLSQGTSTINSRFYSNEMKSIVKIPQATEVGNIVCEAFSPTSDRNCAYDRVNDNLVAIGGDGYIYVKCNTYTDATAFKQAMNGVQLVYELATPITVQLSPTQVKSLEGTNNIFANCGDINNVEYVRNLNITINDLLSRING